MTFQLPTYTERGQAILDGFRERARKLHAFLAAKAADGNYFHDNGKWADVDLRHSDNICATPVCALGWAIHHGVCEGVTIQPVLFADEGYAQLGFSEQEQRERLLSYDRSHEYPYINVATDDKVRAQEIVAAAKALDGTGITAQPVRGKELLNWSDVGDEFFGGVVAKTVFAAGDATLDTVLDRLAQFAAHGYVEVNSDDDDACPPSDVASTIYYHDEEDLHDVGRYYIHYDGAEGDCP
jgi:hypothetical protein